MFRGAEAPAILASGMPRNVAWSLLCSRMSNQISAESSTAARLKSRIGPPLQNSPAFVEQVEDSTRCDGEGTACFAARAWPVAPRLFQPLAISSRFQQGRSCLIQRLSSGACSNITGRGGVWTVRGAGWIPAFSSCPSQGDGSTLEFKQANVIWARGVELRLRSDNLAPQGVG